MSLQEISSLPPNKIVDERGEGNRGGGYRSAQRLSQLTERAVDKALKLQAESGRLVDVVDTQSCGELGEFGCLIKYPFSPSASKILKNTTILIPSSSSRSWALPKESQDRRTVAEKIYSSLIQWKLDVSFEWRSRVVLAVPVLEEALYKVARSKEDYASQQLLEHVLLHFEAGNGLFLLQGIKPLYPVQASHAASTTMGQDTSEHIICGTGDSCQIAHDDAFSWENADVLCANNDLTSGLDSESCLTDNSFLRDVGLEMGHSTPRKVAIHKPRDNPGKRITNRVVSMLSKRSGNLARSRHELIKATHNEENIPSAGVRVDDARTEMQKQNDDASSEPPHIKQESACYGDMTTRKSSRKTLGDMINLNLTSLRASGSSLLINVDEARSMSFMNEDSNCSKHSDTVHSFCTLKADAMRMEVLGPFPSSSNVVSIESSPIELMQPTSSDKARQSTGSSSLQGLPTMLISPPRHTAAFLPSPSPPKPKTSTLCPAHSLSISAASPAPLSALPSSSSPTVSFIASSPLSQVSSSSTATTISLVSSKSQVSSSFSYVSSSLSSSMSSSSSHESSSLVSLSSSSHTAEISAPTSLRLAPSSLPPELPIQPPLSLSLSASSSLSSLAVAAASASSHESSSSSSSSHTAEISAPIPLRLAPSSPPRESPIQPFHHRPPSPACFEEEQSQEFRDQLTATSQEIEREAARRSLLSTTLTPFSSSPASSPSHESSSWVSLSSSLHTAEISAPTPLRLAPSSPPTELSIQSFHCMSRSPACLEGEQIQESREQLTATAAASQEIERETAGRSLLSTTLTETPSNNSLPEAREGGPRLPLSIFLSEKDELDVFSMAGMSGDSGHSWNTWEEPTEQIDPVCCVCMVGLKGAAFIPCGHTFCRKCSRQLWRGRGSCPLCNRYIREILDVY